MRTPTNADEWVELRRGRTPTPEEEAAFQAWLQADPANPEEYDVADTLARVPKFLRNYPPDLAVQAFAEALIGASAPTRTKRETSSRPTRAGMLLAAGIVLLFLVSLLWLYLT